MKKSSIILLCLCAFCFSVNAQKKTSGSQEIILKPSAGLQDLVNRAAAETLEKFSSKGLKAENLAITLIDLRDPNNLETANFRGEEKIYPASVVKLFYEVALHQWLENGKLKQTPALERAEKDMIVISSNEATQFIVDALTETHNGEELSPEKLKKYGENRDVVNRYFAAHGFQNVNVNQKTYCEDLYGRERQWWNAGKNRNALTTNATARLLAEIALGKAVTSEHSAQILDLMKRDWEGTSTDPDDQAHGFTGIALNNLNLKGAKLWSKAGWTSDSRHDAAYIETPAGLKFVLVTFTTNVANERDIIPNVAAIVLRNLSAIKN
ncbi:MAG: serine hydrolase [Pyrinomonadaceae bacterium]